MHKLAEVVTLYDKNASDIASMLRQAAESIESEAEEGFSPTRMMCAVQISESGKVQVYGWGNTETFDCIAALEVGSLSLKRRVLEDQDE